MARIYEYLDANNDKRNILSLHGISLKLKVFLLISSNVLKAICGDMWISDHYKQGGQGFSLGISFILGGVGEKEDRGGWGVWAL